MKPDTIATACAFILVACIAVALSLWMLDVNSNAMIGIALGVGTVAAIIGGRQPA